MNKKRYQIYIVGCKGIPAKYGGFETFVENLVSNKKDKNIEYHVSCMANNFKEFEYKEAKCFNIKLPFDNAFGRLLYVSRALNYIEKLNNFDKKIVYILGCRIGPLLLIHKRRLTKRNVTIFCNPDGLEWKRDKWNGIEKLIIKLCERCLVQNSDLIVSDSKAIEKYINDKYPKAKTTYIAYGAKSELSKTKNSEYNDWCNKNGISKNNYYLVIGRFVPENNYEIIIKEFIKTNTNKKLVFVTNYENNNYYKYLLKQTDFDKDKRVLFAGTIYNEDLLFKIRENAFAYIHGHEVGGTNPSLLEALAHTKLNLLLNIDFNKEVGEDCALYWSKEKDSLKELIEKAESLNSKDIEKLSTKAKQRIINKYNWDKICTSYEKLFKEHL